MGEGSVAQQASPERWANRISQILNAVHGNDRFPVDIPRVAQELSHQLFPKDPITTVKGGPLPGFEGALVKAETAGKGWGIFYNQAITSRGRINFTLAHEFGHYLLHRETYPDGLRCGEDGIVRWDSEYGQVEQQANVFAATLLMPLDDFRRQIDARDKPDIESIGACAERYGVSLVAALLRWLEYTERRAVLVLSREGFILWSRASKRAHRTGAYFRTAGCPPIEIPPTSLAASLGDNRGQDLRLPCDPGTWFADESCEEHALASKQYDFTVSLLHLSSYAPEPRRDTFGY